MSANSRIRVKYEPVTVKEPYRVNVLTFADPDEFTVYSRQHEDEFKGVSTLRLNQSYKIPGYRISIRNRGGENEELILKKDYYGGAKTVESEPAKDDRLAALETRVRAIEQYLEQLH